MVTRAKTVGNALKTALREERALAAAFFLRNLEDSVEANPTLAACFVPFTSADVEPFLFVSMVWVGGDEQPQHGGAGAGDNEHGAFARRGLLAVGGRPDPDDLARICLAVHVGGEAHRARMGVGAFDADAGGFAGFAVFGGVIHTETLGDSG